MHEAYLLKFDEINMADKSIGDIEDDFIQLLAEAYYLGIHEAEEMLHKKIEAELDELEDILYLEIDGMTFIDRMNEHIADEDPSGLQVLAESEFHRVYNTAIFDASVRSGGKTKTWNTMLDERVRTTHEYIEGETVGIDDEFYTYDGDHALFPGGFAKAQNNVNCRCVLTIH